MTEQILKKSIELLNEPTDFRGYAMIPPNYQKYNKENPTYFSCGGCGNKSKRIEVINLMLRNIKTLKSNFAKFECDGVEFLVEILNGRANLAQTYYKSKSADIYITLKNVFSKDFENSCKFIYTNTYDNPECEQCANFKSKVEVFINCHSFDCENSIRKISEVVLEDFIGRFVLKLSETSEQTISVIGVNPVHSIKQKYTNELGDIFLYTEGTYTTDCAFIVTSNNVAKRYNILKQTVNRDGGSFEILLEFDKKQHKFEVIKTENGNVAYFDNALLTII